MEKSRFELSGIGVSLYSDPAPRRLFLQPVDEHDGALLDRQIELMGAVPRPFALAAFQVADWSRDLSPWEAPAVFGSEPFGGKAEETFYFVVERLLPALRERLRLGENTALCLGGYSLAGLFALWAATKTELFTGVAAASPSVWFPGWPEYVRDHPIRAKRVYLSLGDREERTKNPVLASVGNRIRALHESLREEHTTVLEWNPGNHFRDSEVRTAKAFSWVAAREE